MWTVVFNLRSYCIVQKGYTAGSEIFHVSWTLDWRFLWPMHLRQSPRGLSMVNESLKPHVETHKLPLCPKNMAKTFFKKFSKDSRGSTLLEPSSELPFMPIRLRHGSEWLLREVKAFTFLEAFLEQCLFLTRLRQFSRALVRAVMLCYTLFSHLLFGCYIISPLEHSSSNEEL